MNRKFHIALGALALFFFVTAVSTTSPPNERVRRQAHQPQLRVAPGQSRFVLQEMTDNRSMWKRK